MVQSPCHPDQLRKPGAPPQTGHQPQVEPEQTQEFDPEDSVYDSCVDDLDRMLTEPIPEPDPALGSTEASGARNPSSGKQTPISSILVDPRDQPGTAEVFEGIATHSYENPPRRARRAGWGARILSRLTGGAARPPANGPKDAEKPGQATPKTGEFRQVDSGSQLDDEETGTDARGAWLSLLLLSYASAVTLGLVWVLWTGRAYRPAEPRSDGTQTADDSSAKSDEPSSREELPPVPAENLTSVGKTIRIGDVEITPLSVSLAPVELVRRIDPPDYRHEDSNSLVLRFKLTNRSAEHALAPLARNLIRNQAAWLDRSFVATPNRGSIRLFHLAVESEWVILGQDFPVLKPGESGETLVASKPVTEDLLPDEMTWRIRLRIGPYRTDILGVRFSKNDLSP